MSSHKVSIVGAGQVGSTTAHLLLLKQLADVTLIDIVPGLAEGKALDLLQAAAAEGLPHRAVGTTDYAALQGSRIVVVTAGLARKPGMSRDDLLLANAAIVGPIADQIARRCPQAIVITVTNPLDVMTRLVLARTGFLRQRVIGMAGVLDTARLKAFVAQRLSRSPAEVEAMILGSHGELMVPLRSSLAVGGKPLASLLDAQEIDRLLARARDGGAEIVALLKTSSAYYAPASGVAQMVESILKNQRRTLPVCAWLQGEYGITDACIGVPAELGANGLERIVEVPMSAEERTALERAAGQVREMSKLLQSAKAAA